MKKDVVITGVRGFVGRNLKKYLSRNSTLKITGASRDKSALEQHKNDLNSVCSYDDIYDAKQQFDAYVHLAGKVIGVTKKGEEDEYYKVNFEQTKKMFDRFLKDPKAKKFIFVSTIHVLTEKPERVLDESYPPKPFTPYGKSKYLAENYIKDHCKGDKKFYILRPSMIHGPGNKGNLNLLYGLISKGLPYPIGEVNNKRSFVSVDNFSFIINEILSNEVKPGLYHIADDDPTYTHDLIHLIASEIGVKPRIMNINLGLLSFAAKVGNYLPLPLNEHRLQKLTGDFIVSNKKIKNELGKELPVKSVDGIKKTIQSFVGHTIDEKSESSQ
jgi:nucleoside-diphosphate-sugar epimerase